MAAVVVDTDVVSFLHKNHKNAELYREHLDGRLKVISFVTLAELYRWAVESDWGEGRKAALDEHLEDYFVYGVNRPLCRMWATIATELSNSGTQIGVGDTWIAATAILHGFSLVSHNRKHFEAVPNLNLVSEAPRTPPR